MLRSSECRSSASRSLPVSPVLQNWRCSFAGASTTLASKHGGRPGMSSLHPCFAGRHRPHCAHAAHCSWRRCWCTGAARLWRGLRPDSAGATHGGLYRTLGMVPACYAAGHCAQYGLKVKGGSLSLHCPADLLHCGRWATNAQQLPCPVWALVWLFTVHILWVLFQHIVSALVQQTCRPPRWSGMRLRRNTPCQGSDA